VKISIDIDVTPQELRNFFGLPDVTGLHEEMMAQIRKQMLAGMEGMDPMTLMRPFLPEHLRAFEATQKSFWEAMMKANKQENT
jgi:microcystin-dependent protein